MTTFDTRPATSGTSRATTIIGKGWHDDPFAEHRLRYHDGIGWTDHVTHFGPTPCRGCAR